MQQRIHTQVYRLNRGSLSWTELRLGNCKLQEKNEVRTPRALWQSGPTSQLTYSLRGKYIFQSQWAINLNTPKYSMKDMKRERAPWTKEARLPCWVQCCAGLWAPENTVSLSQVSTMDGWPVLASHFPWNKARPCSWDRGAPLPLFSYPRQCGTADKSLCHAHLAAGRGSPDKACLYH